MDDDWGTHFRKPRYVYEDVPLKRSLKVSVTVLGSDR